MCPFWVKKGSQVLTAVDSFPYAVIFCLQAKEAVIQSKKCDPSNTHTQFILFKLALHENNDAEGMWVTWPEEFFFMLNSTEHEISSAHTPKNAEKIFFLLYSS